MRRGSTINIQGEGLGCDMAAFGHCRSLTPIVRSGMRGEAASLQLETPVALAVLPGISAAAAGGVAPRRNGRARRLRSRWRRGSRSVCARVRQRQRSGGRSSLLPGPLEGQGSGCRGGCRAARVAVGNRGGTWARSCREKCQLRCGRDQPRGVLSSLPMLCRSVRVVLRILLPVRRRYEPPAEVLQLPVLEQRGAARLGPHKVRWPVHLDRNQLPAAAINDQVQAVA